MVTADEDGPLRLWRTLSGGRLVPLAVSLLLAVYLLRPQSLWPEVETLRPTALAAGLAILALLIELLGGVRPAGRQVSLWFVIAIAVWALAGVHLALDPATARVHAMTLLKIAAVFYLLRHAMSGRRGFVVTVGTVVACASLLAGTGVYQYLFGTLTDSRIEVLTGPNANANDLAILLAAALPFALAFSTDHPHRWSRLAGGAAGFVLLAGVSAAQSKGASVAVIGVVAAFAWRHRWRGAVWLLAAVSLHLLLPAAAAVTSPAPVRFRPMHYVDGEARADKSTPSVAHRSALLFDVKQRSYTSRIAIWRLGLEIFRQHPVRGVGAGCFMIAYSRAVDPSYPDDLKVRSAHNTFLQGATELGLPGAVLLLGVLVGPLVSLRRTGGSEERRGDGLRLAAVSGWLVVVLGACYLDHLENWVLYFAVAAAEAAAWLPRAGNEVSVGPAERADDDALSPA